MSREEMPKKTLFRAKTYDEQAEGELASLILEQKCTADQIREAYYRVCGVSENTDADPIVETLYAKMYEMAHNHFPLNRLAKMVGYRQDDENFIPEFYQFVDRLKITENENKMLRSIVDSQKVGKVRCFVDNEEIASF